MTKPSLRLFDAFRSVTRFPDLSSISFHSLGFIRKWNWLICPISVDPLCPTPFALMRPDAPRLMTAVYTVARTLGPWLVMAGGTTRKHTPSLSSYITFSIRPHWELPAIRESVLRGTRRQGGFRYDTVLGGIAVERDWHRSNH